MLNDDERLAAEFTQRLRELVREIEPSRSLIDSLDREIRASRGTRFGKLPRRVRRRLLAVSIPAAAAIATGIIVLSGPEVPPSFAVTQSANGTVLVTIRDLEGVAGANARLKELGIDNVAVVPITTSCPTRIDLSYTGIGAQRNTTFRVTPSEIPAGTTVLLGAAPIPSNGIELAVGRITGPAPPCVAPGQSGFGIESVTSSTTTDSSQTSTSNGES